MDTIWFVFFFVPMWYFLHRIMWPVQAHEDVLLPFRNIIFIACWRSSSGCGLRSSLICPLSKSCTPVVWGLYLHRVAHLLHFVAHLRPNWKYWIEPRICRRIQWWGIIFGRYTVLLGDLLGTTFYSSPWKRISIPFLAGICAHRNRKGISPILRQMPGTPSISCGGHLWHNSDSSWRMRLN